MTYVESTDKVKVYYNDMGEGEPAILYMSGWCDSRNSFNQFTFACAKKRRIAAIDWRGHGKSEIPSSDFGIRDLVEDAKSVLEACGIGEFIPVTKANGGWVAIELYRHMPHRIPKMVFIDWYMFGAPQTLSNMESSVKSESLWEKAREKLFSSYLDGVDHPEVIRLVREEMASYGYDMWSRAIREIKNAYSREGSPISALNSFEPKVPVMHLYSQPDDYGYLVSQENFAASHDWFTVRKLNLKSHFLTIEVPEFAASIVEQFIAARQLEATGT